MPVVITTLDCPHPQVQYLLTKVVNIAIILGVTISVLIEDADIIKTYGKEEKTIK